LGPEKMSVPMASQDEKYSNRPQEIQAEDAF
jgi:hypothetical protein